MTKITYTKEDKLKIKQLKDAGVELSGEESPEELNTLIFELDAKDSEGEDSIAEEIEGIPNKLPPVTEEIEVHGKKLKMPIYAVTAVKGGKFAMYSPTGQRVSPAYGVDDILPGSEKDVNPTKGLTYIRKACAKFNIMRRKNLIPGEAISA